VDHGTVLHHLFNKLQRIINAAVRVVSGTKYDHDMTHLLHSELHWLDVADRVIYKLTSLG